MQDRRVHRKSIVVVKRLEGYTRFIPWHARLAIGGARADRA